MEKKFKFTDKPAVSKVIYAAVIAILCITAIVIGIVSASRKAPDTELPTPDGENGEDNNIDEEPPLDDKDDGENKKLTFALPLDGEVVKGHSLSTPVFSLTLGEWRIHAGIDIEADEKAPVMAAEEGVVSAIYNDPMLGQTIEITHSDTHKSYYSNLAKDSIECSVGTTVKQGDVIGYIGDTTISELADEPHLHFEFKVSGESVNPLDYFTEESKLTSLGIVSGDGENSEA